MCEKIYNNCASPVKKLIVQGAAHAESYYKDMKAYEQALDVFFSERYDNKLYEEKVL